ncbi:MAG: amino acid ABC transporter substrate-binding protein [Candidatus Rokuibacteriota bacterium]|nr:MAG: amino acid ABC transporter substrate-binding protein [Candidatus Rokubacteria bacterium]PYN58096.1 MAG: amino acid ABC transporter substrate-binding protein [Candidatus Rokubacteria bacterium]
MKRILAVVVALAVALSLTPPVGAQQDTMAKIKESGVLTIGTRTGSPPFAYINKDNQWVGFSIDLVEQLVKPAVEKEVGRAVKVEKKESTPPTRIPLLSANSVDLIAGTMTDTPQRREVVDFSLTFFYTGAQFLVKKGSPIKGVNDIAGKRIASQQASTNAKIIRERYPQAQLREFPDQPAAFQALLQGQVDAFTNDGIQLAGLKAKAPNPAEWEIVGDFYSEEPYGMAMRKGDARLKAAVDGGLKNGFESGKYFEIYEKWFGPKGELPYPLTATVKAYLLKQIGK